LAFVLYFLLLEISKIVKKNFNVQNIFDWIYHFSVIALVIVGYTNVNINSFRILAVFVVIQTY